MRCPDLPFLGALDFLGLGCIERFLLFVQGVSELGRGFKILGVYGAFPCFLAILGKNNKERKIRVEL